MSTMSPKFQEWLDALRSGKYLQTSFALRDHQGYCCLGVACDVVHPDAWRPFNAHTTEWEHLGNVTLPAQVVQETIGISSSFFSMLVSLNDDLEFDFEQIADYIEGKARIGVAFRNYDSKTAEEVQKEY